MTVTLSTSSPLKHSATVAIALMMFAAALPRSADAQTRPADSGEWQVPTTVHGHPDLQGSWTNATLTPLQRPAGWEPVLTWDKVTEIETGQAEFVARTNKQDEKRSGLKLRFGYTKRTR